MAFRRERSLPACEGWNDEKYEEVMRLVVQKHVNGTLTGSFGPLAKDSYQVSCAGLTRSFGLAETIIDSGQVSGVVHSMRLEAAMYNIICDQPKLRGNHDSAQGLAHEFANHVVAILKVLRTMHAEEHVFESHTAWSKRFPKTGRIRKSLNGTDVFVLQRILNKLSPGGSSPTDSPGKQDSSEPHAPAEAAHGDDFKKVSVRAEEMSRSDEDAGNLQLWPDIFMPAHDAKKPDPSKAQPDPSEGTSRSGWPTCFAPNEAEQCDDEGGAGVSTPNQKKRRSRTLSAKSGSLPKKPRSALQRPAAAGPTDDGDAASKVWVSKGKDICKVEAVFGEGDGKTPSGAVKRKHVKTFTKKRDGDGFHRKGDALKKSILDNRMTLRQIRGMLAADDID